MADYVLKYYKDIPQKDGSTIRLEIHEKQANEDIPAVPIDIVVNPDLAVGVEIGGVVQNLSLQVQGQQGDIDTPIVKTSLMMTFVDAPDKVDGRKNGNWEEFYTADATGWKVILKEKSAYTDLYTAIWGGYITPDSFSEDLTYRGSVSIIARDNLGHLQDFPFDAEGDTDGTITLRDLVRLGFGKIESPMSLDWYGDGQGVNWLYTEYGSRLDTTRMNVSFFAGMNWYEAIEKALYSYGLVMRYIGRNRLHICPLRDMPKHGYKGYDYFGIYQPTFRAGARRELVPAARTIAEKVEYDLQDTISQPQVKAEDFAGVQTTYRCKIEGDNWGQVEHDAPIWAVKNDYYYNGLWRQADASKSLFFDISRYPTGYFTNRLGKDAEMRRYMYIAANNVDTRSVYFYQSVTASPFDIRIKFGQPVALNRAGDAVEQQVVFALQKIEYSVFLQVGGQAAYYYAGNGEWSSVEKILVAEYNPQDNANEFKVEISPDGDIIEGGQDTYNSLQFIIHRITYRQMGYGSLHGSGLYACIQDFAVGIPETTTLMQSNEVKTIYNEKNNVIIERDPELAPVFDSVLLGGFIKNGIFDKDNYKLLPAPTWHYPNGQALQLAVHIHKQLLCYHSKPNNLITGTIVNANGYPPALLGLKCNWAWGNKEHILVSGSLNYLTGHIDNAVLREFVRYEDMWKDEEMPSGYTPLEYVENAGSGYVDTGITIASLDASVSVDCQFVSIPTSSAEMAWGYSKGQNFIPRWCLAAHSGKWYGSPNITTTTGKADTNRHTFEMSVGTSASGGAVYRGKIDGLTLYSETALVYPSDFQLNNMPVYLFARNNNGTADLFGKCRIYGFKVVNGGKITHDLRPCRDADGAVGYYDVVARRFCKGVGSGLTGGGAGEVTPESGGNTTDKPSVDLG